MATLQIYDRPFQRSEGWYVYGWHPETEYHTSGPCIFHWIKRSAPEKDSFEVFMKNINRRYMDAAWAALKAGAALDDVSALSMEEFV